MLSDAAQSNQSSQPFRVHYYCVLARRSHPIVVLNHDLTRTVHFIDCQGFRMIVGYPRVLSQQFGYPWSTTLPYIPKTGVR
jgi:hypothetical protein